VQAESAKPAAAEEAGMEFTLDFPVPASTQKAVPKPVELNFEGISLNLDDVEVTREPASSAKDERWHEVATKLDLAKAYQEMGDQSGAREILDEVLRDGDAEQRETAQTLLGQLG
jgi:pilus assembly protein FimV